MKGLRKNRATSRPMNAHGLERGPRIIASLLVLPRNRTIDQWKKKLGCKTDQELADHIGVERSTVTHYRKSNRIPKHVRLLLRLLAEKYDEAKKRPV
jgi:hypothetical protein